MVRVRPDDARPETPPETQRPLLGSEEFSELLSHWFPRLSEGFCGRCRGMLQTRLQDLASDNRSGSVDQSTPLSSDGGGSQTYQVSVRSGLASAECSDLSSCGCDNHRSSNEVLDTVTSVKYGRGRNFSPVASNISSISELSFKNTYGKSQLNGEDLGGSEATKGTSLSGEERVRDRFFQVRRKKDFVHMERTNGKTVNILDGLELHTGVFDAAEQKKIVDYVYSLQELGRKRKLRERTYSEPRKWMRGKGRVTLQFGCCYNYATDKNGNPPGIIRDEEVDPIPSQFKTVIKRLVQWHVLPPTCVPNSCIVNIYDEGDCIPPHIDHHDFLRPFCTISFLAECNILFGTNLKAAGPGVFSGPVSIPLPVGSVLILKGNGADVAKHCVPSVPAKRISITFRKMDETKLPHTFKPDLELQGLQPLSFNSTSSSPQVRTPQMHKSYSPSMDRSGDERNAHKFGEEDFPPLGSASSSSNKPARKPVGS
ncbi:RNA demethylase ALKBH9B-like [Aristolochia californica]|uniref:RNA demethylase ALKBH9B-like n=1 Tax=Aristolochia californica TaxID=171875 RepID=UPI0035D812C0